MGKGSIFSLNNSSNFIFNYMSLNKIFIFWMTSKLRRWDKHKPKALLPQISDENMMIKQIYEEYEERKRLKKIKFSLLFADIFPVTKHEDENKKIA